MDPIRKSRRQLRDEEGGLVFCWQWLRYGLVRRTTVAVFAAVGIFGLLAAMIQVKTVANPVANSESARVMVLHASDPDSGELLDWARRQSPFPDRWEPRHGSGLTAELRRIDKELADAGRYEPQLRTRVDEPEGPPRLPDLLTAVPAPLPKVRGGGAAARPLPPAREFRVVARAEGALAGRWGEPSMPRTSAGGAELLGGGARFVVGVDPAGSVVFCLALDDLPGDLGASLDSWLRTRRAQPDPEAPGMVLEVVRVHLEAAPVEAAPAPGGGEGPESPRNPGAS